MTNRSAAASDPLRTLFTIGVTGSMSDGELLGRYLDGRAEEAECAFAALVDRHGRMVRHVCRAILGHDHDASDAFQATFLVLARRAGSIRDAESVAPWLFGVARRVALRAKSDASRRRKAERSKAEQDAPRLVAPEPPFPDDWAPLFEELDRLPARYRDPLILCYLEGHSHDRAAALIGCPPGTLRTRLSRAKDRLRSRLTRRGLSPTPILAPLATAVSPSALLPLPTGWAAAASRLALDARGLPLASLSVPLAVSTLRSMTMIALTRSIALGSVALFGLGTGLAGLSAFGDARAVPVPDPTTPAVLVPGPAVRQEAVPGPDPAASISDGETTPSPEAIEVRSEVEEPIPVRSMLIEPGSLVRQGQTVVELDARALIDQLAIQQIATETADADYQNAIKAREIAEVNVMHFIEGTYPFEQRMLFGEIEIAQAELDLARSRLEQMAGPEVVARIELDLGRSRPGFAPAPADGVERPEKPDFASMPIQHQEARIEILRAELSLKKAEGALELLNTYTRDREVKALEAVVERSKADELAKRSWFELEKEKLRRMIEKCQYKAEYSGIVHYAPGIGPGASVDEGQALFRIEQTDPDEPSIEEVQAEVRTLIKALADEIRTRLTRDEPLTDAELQAYRDRYEAAHAKVGEQGFFQHFLQRFPELRERVESGQIPQS